MSLRRRTKLEVPENHDRWLVSYADFITLLFAFFVVMYGLSSINQNKYRDLTSSLGNALGRQTVINTAANPNPAGSNSASNHRQQQLSVLPGLPLTKVVNERLKREHESMTAIGVNMANNLAPLISTGKLRVIQNNQGIRIDISDNILFESGSATLSPSAEPLLKWIAQALATDHHMLQIEGHTDNVPIHNAGFYSNWELSAVRASSMVRMLATNGIEESRLSAVGFGASRPIADNSTADGRGKNRRLSMMILYANTNPLDGSEVMPSALKVQASKL
jgi:chemotaxis protein MotB